MIIVYFYAKYFIPMLSIVIPVYNFDVRKLVIDLNDQCKTAGITYEIIVVDDASEDGIKNINSKIKTLSSVNYKELEKNVGRARIRNLLASMASHSYLLFLDCDASVPAGFIQRYASSFPEVESVICGGRTYGNRPAEDSYMLHWKYGKEKESMDVETRKKNGYKSFMTNNFAISRSVFTKVSFEENIKTYGHEDTLFGIELEKNRIPVFHIDNPVMHIGLEPNDRFLKKSREAVKNLLKIHKKEGVQENITLLKWLDILEKNHLNRLAFIGLRLFKKQITANLYGNRPSLRLFAFYKLAYLVSLKMGKEL